MQTVQVGEFKAELSSILERVQKYGEEFVIEYGKRHKKVAMLVPFDDRKSNKRTFGQMKGQIKIADDFDSEDEVINNMFYGGEIYP